MNRKEFVEKHGAHIKELSKQYGLFPEIVLAQAFIESSDSNGNFGANYNAVNGNNYFGIRPGTNWYGKTISNPDVKSESKIFRAYNSVTDSIEDYFQFITRNPRYAKALVATSPEQQAEELQKAGYAGSSKTYADLLKKVMVNAQKLLGVISKAVNDYGIYISFGIGVAVIIAMNSQTEKK